MREEIGWLKIVFGIFVATDLSLIAWLVQNYDTARQPLLFASVVVAIFVTIGIVWVNKRAYHKIDELEEL